MLYENAFSEDLKIARVPDLPPMCIKVIGAIESPEILVLLPDAT